MRELLLSSDLPDNFCKIGYYFQLTHGRPLLETTHSHDFYEIICLLSGSCVHIVNRIEYQCGEGDIFFLRPPDRHSFRDQTDGTNVAALSVMPCEVENFRLAYGFSSDMTLDKAAPTGNSLKFSAGQLDRASISGLCDRLFALPTEDRPPLCRILLGEFFANLIKTRERSESAMPPSFSAILCEMNKLPAAAEGVGAFLKLSNFSHAQLCRLTKKYLGATPGEYVNSIRMKYAWELVVSGEHDFETICETVGFSSFSYFCKLFEKTFGMSPSKARKSRFSGGRTI